MTEISSFNGCEIGRFQADGGTGVTPKQFLTSLSKNCWLRMLEIHTFQIRNYKLI